MSLLIAGTKFELELSPSDLRAPNYRAEEVGAGGMTRPVTPQQERTFKGHLLGRVDTEARFTIDETTIEGLIIDGEQRYFVEPLRRFTKSAGPEDFVVYKESDVIARSPAECGFTLDGKVRNAVDGVSARAAKASDAAQAAPGLMAINREIELATEADYEYVTALGGSAAADAEILSIMNYVEGIYLNELGLSFKIVYQHTWATPSDPYASSNPATALDEFRSYWNNNLTGIRRDVAHLWTGKDLDGNVIGYARIGAICLLPTEAYGLSQRVLDFDIKADITAHELGHNLGASHPDQEIPPVDACTNSIMQSIVGRSHSFCQFSRDQISSYLSDNNSCLSQTYSISGQIDNGSIDNGATLTLSGPRNKTIEVDFHGNYTFAGLNPGTYTLTASRTYFNFTPASQTVTIVDSDLTGVNFSGSLIGFSISGRVTDNHAAAMVGVGVILSTVYGVVSTTNTDGNGNYRFENVPVTRDYSVNPSAPQTYFTPPYKSFYNLTADQTGVNFTGTVIPTPTPTPAPTPTPTPIAGLTGQIVFASAFQGPRNIYVVDANNTNLKSLTNGQSYEETPEWSPDGTKIAFIRGGYIHVMKADGSDAHQLPMSTALENSPSWSPDGSKIAYTMSEQLWVMNADGSNRTQLTLSRGNTPRWSPDGAKIVFASTTDYIHYQISIMNADGSGETALTNSTIRSVRPRFSPDGTKILFLRGEDSSSQIFVMSANGSNQQSLTPVGSYNDPAWSPDGTKIVYSSLGTLFVMNADGSNQTRLTYGSRFNTQPSWKAAAVNPLDDAQFFVRQHYQDFLNRAPDQGGLEYWAAAITRCNGEPVCVSQWRTAVSAAFFIELEFRETGFFVYLLHKAARGHRPTYAEFMADRPLVVQGPEAETSKMALINELMQRSFFTDAYPSTMTPEEYVDKLNFNAGGALSQAERDALVQGMRAQTETRASVLRKLIADPDFQSAEDQPSFVLMQYFGYLRRDPDPGGYDFWLGILRQNPANLKVMVCAFITSPEYQQRFSPNVTRVDSECSAIAP